MPRYTYRCRVCTHEFEVFRVPSTTFTTKNTGAIEKTGQVVKEFIEDARKEIEAEKEKMKLGLDK